MTDKCDCGETYIGKYTGRIGAQLGDLIYDEGGKYARKAKKAFKQWTGLGDYRLIGNSLIQGYSQESQPQMMSTGRGIVVRHREYIGEVLTSPVTSGAFSVQQYTLNPGNVATFPWLSCIATQFEQYKPKGIIFEFKSTATDTTTAASLGSCIMSADYDCYDSFPQSKFDMLQMAYSQESKMSDSMAHGIECSPEEIQRKVFYVNGIGRATQGDLRDAILCNFFVATQGGGLPAGQSVGSLYVHYEFEFFKEQVFGGLRQQTQLWQIFKGVNNAAIATGVIGLWNFYRQGLNLGIQQIPNASGQGWIFPTWMEGALVRISYWYQQSITFNITNTGSFLYTNCSGWAGVPTDGSLIALSGFETMVPTSNTFNTYNSFAQQWVLMNDTLPVAATVQSSSWSNFPTSLSSGTNELVVMFEVVPRSFFTTL